jgi:hypothetical protein
MVIGKRMANIDIEARSSFVGVEAGYEAGDSKLEVGRMACSSFRAWETYGG